MECILGARLPGRVTACYNLLWWQSFCTSSKISSRVYQNLLWEFRYIHWGTVFYLFISFPTIHDLERVSVFMFVALVAVAGLVCEFSHCHLAPHWLWLPSKASPSLLHMPCYDKTRPFFLDRNRIPGSRLGVVCTWELSIMDKCWPFHA